MTRDLQLVEERQRLVEERRALLELGVPESQLAEIHPRSPRMARVYLGPEPPYGPHPGIRGPIRVDALGVHISPECEWLFIQDLGDGTWPESEWEPLLKPQLIPWHRVDSIEWEAL